MSSSRRKRVLLVTPDFPPAFGGIQRLMHRLTENLEQVDVLVVTLDDDKSSDFDRVQRVNVTRVAGSNRIGHPGTIALLNARALLEATRYRPDVVLSGHISVAPAALAVNRLLSKPYVQYLHGRELVIRPRLTRAALRGATAIVAVSSYTRDLAIRHGAEPGRVHIIPPGVDLPPPPSVSRSDPPTIVSVARLEQRYKGQDILIRALPLVRSRVPRTKLVLVGDGPMRHIYESLARSLSLAHAVAFAGAVEDDERDRLLDASHVFAMTSRLPYDGGGEGFGIVYLEAAAHGLPAVAGDIAGARDAVIQRETGILVDPTDHVAVADALVEILADPEIAQRLAKKASERAREFAWPHIARRVEELLLSAAR